MCSTGKENFKCCLTHVFWVEDKQRRLIFIRDLALRVGSHISLMRLVSEHPAVRSVTLPGPRHQMKGKRASEM